MCGGFVDDLSGLLRSAAAVRGSAPAGEPPRARLIEGLAVLVANLAQDRPVIVFLDDVHVADASSWDALHYLARNLSAAPVLVVAAARPAELAAQLGPTHVLLGLEQDGLLRRLELGPSPRRQWPSWPLRCSARPRRPRSSPGWTSAPGATPSSPWACSPPCWRRAPTSPPPACGAFPRDWPSG